jgi:hypothetical protein
VPIASPPYPLDRRLGGSQNRRGHYGEQKNLFALPQIEPGVTGCLVCCPTAVPTDHQMAGKTGKLPQSNVLFMRHVSDLMVALFLL